MPSRIDVRILNSNESHVLDNVLPDLFDNSLDAVSTDAFFASDLHHIAVALDGPTVVGMSTATTLLHPDKAPVGFIAEVGVHDDYLRRGIATRLLKCLMAHLRDLGITDIWLATETDNVPARGLYQSLDARETQGIVVYDWGHAMDG